MIRSTALLFLAAALALSGCKKTPKAAKNDAPAPVAEAVASTAPATTEAGKQAAAPPPPEFDKPATPAPPKAPAAPAINNNAAVIAFCYHNIEDGKSRALTIGTAQFEREMQEIKDAGYSVIKMQDFLAWRRGEKNIPAKSALITIDDGWVSGYTTAWPILKKFDYPFTLFVYVNYLNTGGKSLSWSQLEEMRDAGVDIQSHTYSHANLRIPTARGSLDAKNMALVNKDIATLGKEGWMRKEIGESKKKIEQQLGIKVNALAYPFGVYNDEARRMIKEAGYEAAFTVYGQRLSRSSQFDILGRYAIDDKNPKIFKDALAMIGGGGGTPVDTTTTVGQLAASSMVTQPLNGETITNPLPLIKANLATMGDIEPGSLDVRLSGVGPLAAQFNPETKLMTAQVTQKLKPDNYTVIVKAKIAGVASETRWNFTVGQSAAAALMAATPPPVATPPPATAATPAAKPVKKKK